MGKDSELLIDDNELLILQTRLAVAIGDRPAIALQQIHYWLNLNRKAKKESHFTDGVWWVYNTWAEWHQQNFPFWSIPTIRRVFDTLAQKGLIQTRPHEDRNKGMWVTIAYEVLKGLSKTADRLTKKSKGSDQNDQGGLIKMIRLSDQNDQPTSTTEIITETTSETTEKKEFSTALENPISNAEKQAPKAPAPIKAHKSQNPQTLTSPSEESRIDPTPAQHPLQVPSPAPARAKDPLQEAVCFAFNIKPGGYAGKLGKWLTANGELKGEYVSNPFDEPATPAQIVAWRLWLEHKHGADTDTYRPQQLPKIVDSFDKFRADKKYDDFLRQGQARLDRLTGKVRVEFVPDDPRPPAARPPAEGEEVMNAWDDPEFASAIQNLANAWNVELSGARS